ncbi:hypothetical protein AX14_012460 [Amanita brunnescens Koide BX004]|nr:hypothetical protein AX14_012460 [Amanita brunnescens Koide BX004]
MSYKDFIPSLETDVKKASSYFRKEHRKLITNLAKCISELRSTGGSSAIANASSLITDATKLYDKHTEEQHYNSAPQYPSNLAGLEGALADFEFFIAVVENDGLHLTAIKDFILALAKHAKVVIVPMPPLFTDADNNLRRLSSLAPAAHIAYSNQNPQIPVFCLYFEGQDMLDRFLNDGKVIQLFRPEIYVGTKSSDGTLTWKLETVSKVLALMPKTLYHFALDFVVDAFHKTTNIYVLKVLDKLDSAQSFSVNISGWAMKNYCGHDSPFLVLSDSDGKQQIIFLRMNLTFEILVRVSETKWFMMSRDITAKLTDNGDFSLTFVQNIETSKWIFYFNGKEISNQPIGKANFGKLSLSICKLDGKKEESFSGGIYDVSIYSSALTEVEPHIALSRSILKSADTTKFTQVKEAFACVERSEVCDAAP